MITELSQSDAAAVSIDSKLSVWDRLLLCRAVSFDDIMAPSGSVEYGGQKQQGLLNFSH